MRVGPVGRAGGGVRVGRVAGAPLAGSSRASAGSPGTPGVPVTSAAHPSDTGKSTISGTSAAAPHTTGAAAPHLGTHPRATPSQTEKTLVEGALRGLLSGLGPGSPDRLLWVPGC
ncbi:MULTISPECIES: S8 family serine peptidase [unclassified Streptomyces]|uniref:S8 family serine peptidase n=1 Tax=unclassified Streptomyces TaxID=2593676 RepID=UPI00381FF98D